MKRAFLLSPLVAAIFFTVPESWQLMHTPDSGYIPVIYELLMLLFGFLAVAVINGVIIMPLCWLVKMKSSNLFFGILLAFFVSLIGTTVAYAFEIFDYQTSILHPAYLYPLLIPLFVVTLLSFFFLTRQRDVVAEPAPEEDTSVEEENHDSP